MPEPLRILFVCTGNICRSPMAEGMARARVEERYGDLAREITFSSAGVAGLDGERPTREAVVAMKARGVDISEHRARTVSTGLIAASDLVLTMEARHTEHVEMVSAPVPVFLLKKLGEAARRALESRDETLEGMPGERLTRLLSIAASNERRGGWDLPAFSYEVADPIGRPFDEYVSVADAMEEPVLNVLRVLFG